MSLTDRINPTSKAIATYLDELINNNYQIPTFQREVVWEQDNVKKLWDSVYKFYPLGSILVWKTDSKLHNHRKIGGHKITESNHSRSEYHYLLDGQQRTTSLLTSLYGGEIEGRPNFDPSLYVDLTIESESDTDDESYKKRFLYWNEIDDKEGAYKANIGKKKRFDEGLIVKLLDIKENYSSTSEKIVNHPEVSQNYNHPYWVEIRKIQDVLHNYRLSFIELKGIEVAEVCQIFERINQAGKPLDIFDIVVAKTFKEKSEHSKGFYLRDLIENFRSINNSRFLLINDFDYLQIIAILIRENIENSGVRNITPRYLNDIRTEQIETVWDKARTSILKTFDFFENTLGLKGPQLIPYRYFYLTLANYFYNNNNPNYDFLKKYFWYYSFHRDDLLSNTGNINTHIDFLNSEKNNKDYTFPRFIIDKDTLRKSSYSSKGRLSRAILSLYAHKSPKDWKHTDRNVNVDNFFFSTDKPNLHHIFPTDYILKNTGSNKLDSNSLMNIVYLTQITNLEISNKNPLDYIKDYESNPNFREVINSHLLPEQILEWSSKEEMASDALDTFIESRIEKVISELRKQLKDITIEVIDTKDISNN